MLRPTTFGSVAVNHRIRFEPKSSANCLLHRRSRKQGETYIFSPDKLVRLCATAGLSSDFDDKAGLVMFILSITSVTHSHHALGAFTLFALSHTFVSFSLLSRPLFRKQGSGPYQKGVTEYLPLTCWLHQTPARGKLLSSHVLEYHDFKTNNHSTVTTAGPCIPFMRCFLDMR